LAQDPAMAPIARATALSAWPGGDAPPAWVEEGLDDPAPLLRLGAVRGLAVLHVNQRYRYLQPLLTDDVKSVRIEAARMLAPLLDAELSEKETEVLKAASAELALADRVTADWPETQLALGELHALKGEFGAAEAAIKRALRLHPGHVQATVALAELLQSTGRTEQAVSMLTETVHALPEEAPARFALGMALIKKGDVSKALDYLRQASEMAPDELRYAYVYGIGLNSSGDPAAAIGVLETALDHHGQRPDLLEALATIERDRGRPEAALAHAKKLLELSPDDHGAADLVLELETTPADEPAPPRKEPPPCAEC
jgi:tetratricopeptide (TPR) repeat protein